MADAVRLGEGAALVIQSDGEALSVHLFQDGGDEADIAWQAPDSDPEQFKWLVNSAAAFHKIRVEDESTDDNDEFPNLPEYVAPESVLNLTDEATVESEAIVAMSDGVTTVVSSSQTHEHTYPDEWDYSLTPSGHKTCTVLGCAKKIYD